MPKDNRIILIAVRDHDAQGNPLVFKEGMEDELNAHLTVSRLRYLESQGAVVGDWDENLCKPETGIDAKPEAQLASTQVTSDETSAQMVPVEALQAHEDTIQELQGNLAAIRLQSVQLDEVRGKLIASLEQQLGTANTNLKLATDEGVRTVRRAEEAEANLAERDTLIAERDAAITDLKAQLEAAQAKATHAKPPSK